MKSNPIKYVLRENDIK